jgi:murein L,D-transpeptidase YafK
LPNRALRRFARPALLGTVLASLALAGCVSELDRVKAGSIYKATFVRLDERNMELTAPILVRVFKESKELEVWKQDRTGTYRLLKTYPVCYYSGTLGPKLAEGDRQAPEGFYGVRLGQMNPRSIEHLSFNVGFPNAFDQAHGRTGSALMIHGGCRSVGCYAMTDEHIEEIYRLAYEAFRGGQAEFQVQAFPFRMTEANLEAHKADPNIAFWRSLKRGSDLFEETGRPPQVDVCDKAYAFGAEGEAGSCTTKAI